MAKDWALLLTCEHGGAEIPQPYSSYLSSSDRKLLKTHRGWDAGALKIARQLQAELDCPLIFSEVSRLLVDLNRSAHHHSCLGPAFRDQSEDLKKAIFERYYWPHRQKVDAQIRGLLKKSNAVLHIAVHSFTPVLNGEVRTAELGLLYDPARKSEKKWADRLYQELKPLLGELRIRRNYPYLGKSDGLTRALRKDFGVQRYAGIEVEVNQNAVKSKSELQKLGWTLTQALRSSLL